MLESLHARAHPEGHRIDLAWTLAEDAAFPDMRVIRREGTFATDPEPAQGHGAVIADTQSADPELAPVTRDADGVFRLADRRGLHGERVYYYALFPYVGDPPTFSGQRHTAIAAATSPWGMAELMAELLPTIYHRFDTVLPVDPPTDMSPADRQRGQLRRFLELPGAQLDQLYSLTRNLLDFYDPERVDGRLLPLLASWIGWKTDHHLEIDRQRLELQSAPAIYRRIGTLPTVTATVKRVSDWESRPKEMVHNVFASQRPERLNLWSRRREDDTWEESSEPLSLNFAWEGRPAATRDADDRLWLFFHTRRHTGGWSIWAKTHTAEDGFSASFPVVDRPLEDRHPAAAFHADRLWLFWDVYDPATRRWRIDLRTHEGGEFSAVDPTAPFARGAEHDDAERREPVAAVDSDGGLWLFWRERRGRRWRFCYSRHDGADWLAAARTLVPDPGIDADHHLLADGEGRLWLFGARRVDDRWSVVYTVKPGLDPEAEDWSAVRQLAKVDPDHHEREPAVVPTAEGELELFLTTNRDGGWSIWRGILEISGAGDITDVAAHGWDADAAEAVTGPPWSERLALPIAEADGLLLVYRSNRGVTYQSTVDAALTSRDDRYAGSTTVDTRNTAKLELRDGLGDFAAYTYDTGRRSEDLYRRDTVAIHLDPDGEDPETLIATTDRLRQVVREFLPATDRAVFRQP